MFEESIRVPLIVRWPGVVAPGTEVEQVVSNLDTFPSVLDIAGIGMPAHLIDSGAELGAPAQGGTATGLG